MAVLAVGCSSSNDRAVPMTTLLPALPAPAASTVDGVLALGRPVVLAHAAGEDAHPHSTPYGYADSARAGVDVLDLDVQLSSDGVLVVQHDDTVDRTTDGTGPIAGMTYAQLRKLDNAYWFTKECTCTGRPKSAYVLRGMRTAKRAPLPGYSPEDFVIPRFDDIAKKFPKYVLNIEIKGEYPAAVPAAEELARILVDLHRESSAVVTAFDDQLAEAFHRAAPTVEITPGLSATTAYVLSHQLPVAGRRILQVPPDYQGLQVLTPELVARTKADGLTLWIWPNDSKWENAEGYRKLLDLGVGGINAAQPAIAVDTLGAWTPPTT